jgi:uncharacterized protein (DUF697 family)
MTNATTSRVDERVRALVERCGYAAAAITLLPIPGSDLVAVMPIHVGMVVRIGDAYGVDIDRDSATKMILRIGAAVGLSLVGTSVARIAAKFLVPFAGGLIAAPMVFASTLAIGRVAQSYFEHGGELSDDEIRDLYRDAESRAKKAFDPRKAKSAGTTPDAMPEEAGDLSARLERLQGLHDKGLIGDDEFQAARARILSEL